MVPGSVCTALAVFILETRAWLAHMLTDHHGHQHNHQLLEEPVQLLFYFLAFFFFNLKVRKGVSLSLHSFWSR
jgi:hypothetical protein